MMVKQGKLGPDVQNLDSSTLNSAAGVGLAAGAVATVLTLAPADVNAQAETNHAPTCDFESVMDREADEGNYVVLLPADGSAVEQAVECSDPDGADTLNYSVALHADQGNSVLPEGFDLADHVIFVEGVLRVTGLPDGVNELNVSASVEDAIWAASTYNVTVRRPEPQLAAPPPETPTNLAASQLQNLAAPQVQAALALEPSNPALHLNAPPEIGQSLDEILGTAPAEPAPVNQEGSEQLVNPYGAETRVGSLVIPEFEIEPQARPQGPPSEAVQNAFDEEENNDEQTGPSGSIVVATGVNGVDDSIATYPNVLEGNLNVGRWGARIRGMGGYEQLLEALATARTGRGGVEAQLTVDTSFVDLLFNLAYIQSDTQTEAIVPVDEFGNVNPNVRQTMRDFGTILQAALGRNGRAGTVRLEFGHSGQENIRNQTLVDRQTHDMGQPAVTESPAPGVSIERSITGELEETLTRIYNGTNDDGRIGWRIVYNVPISRSGVELGLGVGQLHLIRNQDEANTFVHNAQGEITSHITITDADGSDYDSNTELIDESSTETTAGNPLSEYRRATFLELLGRFNHPRFQYLRANGRLIINLDQMNADPDGERRVPSDDDNLLDWANTVAGQYTLMLHIPIGVNIAGYFYHNNGERGGDVLLTGAGTPPDLIENYFLAIGEEQFSFRPQDFRQFDARLARANLMRGLRGPYLQWTNRSGAEENNIVRAGWGWPQVAFSVGYGVENHELEALVSLNPDLLNGHAVALRFSRSDDEDYDVSALYVLPLGGGR